MVFHFSIYHGGLHEVVQLDLPDDDRARAEACRLLSDSTDRIAGNMAPGEQVRVVVSGRDGTELFTLSYVVAGTVFERSSLKDTQKSGRPLGAIIES